jgi:GT2 family glycosyltransferase
MDVSITVPAYNPNKEILSKLVKAVKSQKYKGNVELIIVDEKKGFSTQMNIGIKKSKYNIVVMLPQDCVPADKYWLKNLIKPFENKEVIASVSKVEYPKEYWNSFNYLTKGIMIKEKGIITSTLDGKGGAYRKEILESIGLFDEDTFLFAGEDYDTYVKIKDKGTIAYPKESKIIHYHPTNFLQRLRKSRQYANGYGALTRVHGIKMKKWYVGLIKALPFFGLITYPLSYPWKKGGLVIFPAYLIASFIDHFYFIPAFWKGFIDGKQTFR